MRARSWRRWSLAATVALCLSAQPGHAISEASAQGAAGVGADAGSGISWPPGQALPRFARPTHLDVLDLWSCNCADLRLLGATLEGIVNRRRPAIYVLDGTNATEGEFTWLDTLHVPFTVYRSAPDLLRKYRSSVRGVVVYDPSQPDSINVATALAGVRDAVVASPTLGAQLRARLGLPILADLRGMFHSRLQAYGWEYSHVWPSLTRRMIASLAEAPGAYLRDYAVANRAAVVWLDMRVPAERTLLARFLDDLTPDSPFLGYYPNPDHGGEFAAVDFLARHGVYALPSDFSQNLTVFAGTSAPLRTLPAPAPARLANRIYVTLAMTDGDNLQYIQHRLRVLWGDPNRGRVPIAWSLDPLLADAAPAMLAYYQATATPDDTFVTGPSGAGYTLPSSWPVPELTLYTRQSSYFAAVTGIRVAFVYDQPNSGKPFDPRVAGTYARDMGLSGVLYDWSNPAPTTISFVNGVVPIVSGYQTGSVRSAERVLAGVARSWDRRHPAFVSIRLNSWMMTPSDALAIRSALGPKEFQFVSCDQFMRLLTAEHEADG